MVVGAFPAAKLVFLLARTISKPLANSCKERAKRSPFFRKYICLPPATFYNWVEVKTKMWVLNLGQPVQVPPLNEAMAIELGANLLGEAILLLVGVVILIIENRRQTLKQEAKDKEEKEEKNRLHLTIRDLSLKTETQETQLRELFRHVYDLESRVVKVPRILGSKPVTEEPPSPSQLPKQTEGIISKVISQPIKNILGSQELVSRS